MIHKVWVFLWNVIFVINYNVISVVVSNDIVVNINWDEFLERHDLLWEWSWGSASKYTLQPRESDLNHCGFQEGNAACCLEASTHQNNAKPNWLGYMQIALYDKSTWGCFHTALPPGECCLPVPGGGKISGCHAPEETRWDFNQFFSPHLASNGTFQLVGKGLGEKCAAVSESGVIEPQDCKDNVPEQLWRILTPKEDTYLLQNVGNKSCVVADAASEGGDVSLGKCITSQDRMWKPLCSPSGKEMIPGWACVDREAKIDIKLAACNRSETKQHWQLESDGTIIDGNGGCLTAGNPVSVVECSNSSNQIWTAYSGFFSVGENQCLAVKTSHSFCIDTICPKTFAQNFTDGSSVITSSCHNGDRSQLFGAYTLKSNTSTAQENLVPLSWATSAYIGNGIIGVRVQSGKGSEGMLHLFIDNVELGAGAKRLPTGYFKFSFASYILGGIATPMSITLRQRIYQALLEGQITDATGRVLMDFNIFVNANQDPSVVVIEATWNNNNIGPVIKWVPARQGINFAWYNVTQSNHLIAYATVTNTNQKDATELINRAISIGRNTIFKQHLTWWASYWPQSFISLPVTRLEGFYYTQMYRFPSSDRVTLHGLMGAFGPTGNFNRWNDYVWDMNEQVMYWLTTNSNRPALFDPLMNYIEKHGLTKGGLWMFHNYVKQARINNDFSKLQFAWGVLVNTVADQAGKNQNNPGSLKLIQGTYHITPCGSPEYKCSAPFEHLACKPNLDCNYALSQLRWGLRTVIDLTLQFHLETNLTKQGVDIVWWQSLLSSKLAWYPFDEETGFRLDTNCAFKCPHRHFSHLLQMYDLETIHYSSKLLPHTLVEQRNITIDTLMTRSLDNWFAVTCNNSNWFNEECRGFTQCGMAAMSVATNRSVAAVGNLTNLIDSVATPNGMYGEMVFQGKPSEFSPVSESSYCVGGVLHMMLLRSEIINISDSSQTRLLHIFPGIPSSWSNAVFHQLRTFDALLVSAVRKSGRTAFVRLQADAQTIVFFRVHDVQWCQVTPIAIPSSISITPVSDVPCAWSLVLKKHQYVLLYVDTTPPKFEITPLKGNVSEYNWYGFRRQMHPMH